MALLYYKNLGLRRPEMKQAFYGLKDFNSFLKQTKCYMESDEAVLRLAWKPGISPEDKPSEVQLEGPEDQPFWVQLEEPEDSPNEIDRTLDKFLDENTRELYELPDDPEGGSGNKHPNQRYRFSKDNKIKVMDRDPKARQLLLEQRPSGNQLLLRPNTYTLRCQIQAIRDLQNRPLIHHRPLLRLMESEDHAKWFDFEPERLGPNDWRVLTDESRPGTDEQRRFVECGLATPDFVLLEGPPGSGKTTAICELVLQLAEQGKRALLCASTHVAVDNVLERLMDERNRHKDAIIPVRIGDKKSVSEKAAPWQLENFVKTERERLLAYLTNLKEPTESQRVFLGSISHKSDDLIERMVLEAANLVCGTTIGILQHPDIKNISSPFDVLIVDEASKTTFQEFLVPALFAKRWIIVGDPKQLSPYVDEEMSASIKPCLKDPAMRNACVDVFMAGQGKNKRRIAAVVTETDHERKIYAAQAEKNRVVVADAGEEGPLYHASIITGNRQDIERRLSDLPLDIATVRHKDQGLDSLRRRAAAWRRLTNKDGEAPEWEKEIAWRLTNLYGLRLNQEEQDPNRNKRSNRQHLHCEIEQLLPYQDGNKVEEEIDRVRRVALPSILESLQCGFERNSKQRKKVTALTDGLPPDALEQRHVLLGTQHRMHPEIAAFSHEHIYNNEALHTPDYMESERTWGYGHYEYRAIWLDIKGDFNHNSHFNPKEAEAACSELHYFDRWAKDHPREDDRLWEVAILTFYRKQEEEIQGRLRSWTGQRRALHHFYRGRKERPYLSIELCTVDRFQGHEADLVVISIANYRPTYFLENLNRLNVALTRARYQGVIIGDRKAMAKSESALGQLAESKRWGKSLQGENQ